MCTNLNNMPFIRIKNDDDITYVHTHADHAIVSIYISQLYA